MNGLFTILASIITAVQPQSTDKQTRPGRAANVKTQAQSGEHFSKHRAELVCI